MDVICQLHTPAALPGKSPCYPLDRRLSGPQTRSGRGSEEKNSQSPPGIDPLNPDRPASSLVATPTELSRLSLCIKVHAIKVNTNLFPCALNENHIMKTYWEVEI
jgi:hypothetical protein